MRFRLSRRAIGSSGAGTALRSRVKMGAGLGATAFLVGFRKRLGRDSFLGRLRGCAEAEVSARRRSHQPR